MSKPLGTYKIIDLPDYKDLSLDELVLFAKEAYDYGYEYGLEVNWYLYEKLQETK